MSGLHPEADIRLVSSVRSANDPKQPFRKEVSALPMLNHSVQIFAVISVLALSLVAQAGQSRLEIASTISAEKDLQLLVDTSFGGGRYYRVDDSKFYVVHLHPTSGIVTNELYIFEMEGDELRLLAFVPTRFMTTYRVEYADSQLRVFAQKTDEDETELVVQFSR